MILDRNILYKQAILHRDAREFTRAEIVAGVLQMVGSATVTLSKVGGAGTGFVGWKFDAASDVASDGLVAPVGVDWDNDTFWRVLWATDDADAAKSVSWVLVVAKGDANSSAAPSGAKTLSFGADNVVAADTIHATKWVRLDGKSFRNDGMENDVLAVDVKVAAGGFLLTAAKVAAVLGYDVAHLPKLTDAGQVPHVGLPKDA